MKQIPALILCLLLTGNTFGGDEFPPPPGPFGLIDQLKTTETKPKTGAGASTEALRRTPDGAIEDPQQAGFGPVIIAPPQRTQPAYPETAHESPLPAPAQRPRIASPNLPPKHRAVKSPAPTHRADEGFRPMAPPRPSANEPARAKIDVGTPTPPNADHTPPVGDQGFGPVIPRPASPHPTAGEPAPTNSGSLPSATGEGFGPVIAPTAEQHVGEHQSARFRPATKAPPPNRPAPTQRASGDWRFAPPGSIPEPMPHHLPPAAQDSHGLIQMPNDPALLQAPSASIQMRWPPSSEPRAMPPNGRVKSARSLYEALTGGVHGRRAAPSGPRASGLDGYSAMPLDRDGMSWGRAYNGPPPPSGVSGNELEAEGWRQGFR